MLQRFKFHPVTSTTCDVNDIIELILTFLTYPGQILSTQSFKFCFRDQKVSQYRHFRGRINNFFMHFVSEIIFEPDYTPSEEMIKWLLQCITSSEAQFSLFDPDSVISISSSVNMFLLKLLLQSLHIDVVSSVLNNKLSSSNSVELHHQILEHFRVSLCCKSNLTCWSLRSVNH